MATKKEKTKSVEISTEQNIEKTTEQEVTETPKPQKRTRTMSEKTKQRNAITFEYMIEYIQKNAPQDKSWFKEIAFDNKKYNHFTARKAFIDRYMPELKTETKQSKWDMVENW